MSSTTLRFDLSGVALELVVRDRELADRLRDLWTGFEHGGRPTTPVASLDVECVRAADAGRPIPGKRVEVTQPGGSGSVALVMDEGRMCLDRGGDGRIETTVRDPDRTAWAVHNLVLSALAWAMARERHGAVLHAATIVLDGHAFALIGPEGAGKSTFARVAAEAGETVVGEDLVVIDGAGTVQEVLASPFRVEHATRRGPGRWPLAAILVPCHGAEPGLEPVDRVAAIASVAANLPYLAGGEVAMRTAESVVGRCVIRRLTFAPEPAFLDVLRSASAGPGCGSVRPRT